MAFTFYRCCSTCVCLCLHAQEFLSAPDRKIDVPGDNGVVGRAGIIINRSVATGFMGERCAIKKQKNLRRVRRPAGTAAAENVSNRVRVIVETFLFVASLPRTLIEHANE